MLWEKIAKLFAVSAITILAAYTSPPKFIPRDYFLTLQKIGLESTIDDIERGGVGLLHNGRIQIYEIENDVRYDDKRYERFIEGDTTEFDILLEHLKIATDLRSICTPEGTASFNAEKNRIEYNLRNLLNPECRKKELIEETWRAYDTQVRHLMYLRAKDPPSGTIHFHFHTHTNGTPPSIQDINLSKNRTEIVVSVDEFGGHIIYEVSKGNVKILDETQYIFAQR